MTDKLTKLQMYRLHNMEVPKLISRFITEYEASKIKATDEDFKRIFARLKTNLEAFVAMDQPITRNQDKRVLRAADEKREKYLKVLMTTVKAWRHTEVKEERDAYNNLSTLLKFYREVSKRNYEEQSYAIEDLLTKLKQEPYRTAVTTFQLTKLVSVLTETQTQFETLFAKTTTQQENRMKTSQLKKARRELYDEYQHLCEYVYIMWWLKGTDQYRKILAVINKSRDFYVDVIDQRKGKKNKKESELPNSDNAMVTEDSELTISEKESSSEEMVSHDDTTPPSA